MVLMSLQERNRFAPSQAPDAELVYPAEFHFRIIVEVESCVEQRLAMAVTNFRVTAPLAASRHSAGGRYLAYGLSVLVASREEQQALVDAVKGVPGVRMVL